MWEASNGSSNSWVGSYVRRGMRPEVWTGEAVGVESPSVDLDAEQFFEADVREPHLVAEEVQHRELTRLRRSFEDDRLEATATYSAFRRFQVTTTEIIK